MATSKLPNLENSYLSANRFTDVNDLYNRYLRAKENFNKERDAWQNFQRAYERWSYQTGNGRTEPNWGQFKGRVDKAIEVFESLITERENWARISPIDIDIDRRKYVSDKITSEFHELCIRPWEDRDDNMRKNIYDMVMFSKGISSIIYLLIMSWCNKDSILSCA